MEHQTYKIYLKCCKLRQLQSISAVNVCMYMLLLIIV